MGFKDWSPFAKWTWIVPIIVISISVIYLSIFPCKGGLECGIVVLVILISLSLLTLPISFVLSFIEYKKKGIKPFWKSLAVALISFIITNLPSLILFFFFNTA
tara:strand:+ start:702 stop:1010 length:309 start_codon:yes stop_codon:yes gene_type:complete